MTTPAATAIFPPLVAAALPHKGPDMPDPNPYQNVTLATAGLELVGILGVLLALGYGLDHWQGTEPWGIIGGAVIGIVGGLIRFVRQASRSGG